MDYVTIAHSEPLTKLKSMTRDELYLMAVKRGADRPFCTLQPDAKKSDFVDAYVATRILNGDTPVTVAQAKKLPLVKLRGYMVTEGDGIRFCSIRPDVTKDELLAML